MCKGESLEGMYASRPDNYLKGYDSAGLVRQKADSTGGSKTERNRVKEGAETVKRGGRRVDTGSQFEKEGRKKKEDLAARLGERDGNSNFTMSE